MNHRKSTLRTARTPFRTRRWIAAALALLVALALPLPSSAQDFRLPGLRGGQLTSADLGQGATIVVVWASWSPRCRDIVDRVNALQARWGSRARVVTVDFQEDRGTVDGFLSGKNLSVPVYLDEDGAFSKKHAVTTLPGLLVIRDGSVAYRGKLPDDADRVLAEILQ